MSATFVNCVIYRSVENPRTSIHQYLILRFFIFILHLFPVVDMDARRTGVKEIAEARSAVVSDCVPSLLADSGKISELYGTFVLYCLDV